MGDVGLSAAALAEELGEFATIWAVFELLN